MTKQLYINGNDKVGGCEPFTLKEIELKERIKNLDAEIKALKFEDKKLSKKLEWLNCLEAAGVDNWEGIDYACDLMSEKK